MRWPEGVRNKALREYGAGLSCSEVSNLLGVPKPTVKCWVKAAGITRGVQEAMRVANARGRGRSFGEGTWVRVVELYRGGLSAPQVAKQLGLSVNGVTEIVRRAGAVRSKSEAAELAAGRTGATLRRYTVDSLVFRELTAERAWALGVVFGNGCIVRYRGKLRGLDVCGDEDVCLKVRAVLASDVPLIKRSGCCVMRFNHPGLAAELSFFGVTPRKARTIPFPELPDALLSHFVRGFWDTDGTVCRKGGKYLFLGASSASRAFMEPLRAVTNGVTGSRSRLTFGSGVYRVGYSNRMAHKLGAWLWADSAPEMRGERKHRLFEEICLGG